MKSCKIIIIFGGILLTSILLISCTKEVSYKPNYIYKAAPSNNSIAKIGNDIITESELYRGIEGDIFDAQMKLYEIKMNRLQALTLKKLINDHPDKKNLSNDDFLEKYISKGIKVTKKDIDRFARGRKIPKEQVEGQLKERIIKYLEMELKKKAVDRWVAEQTNKTPVEVYLKKPERFIFKIDTKGSSFKGSEGAKVTIIEYIDFQDPFCAKGHGVMRELEKKYKNRLKFVVKHFPLPFHRQGKIAATASFCAGEQDKKKMWIMHDLMFKNQNSLSKKDLKELAKRAGLDSSKLANCLESNKFKQKVSMDIQQGRDLGLKSVPVFFVNGKLVNGAHPVEVFAEIIDQELSI